METENDFTILVDDEDMDLLEVSWSYTKAFKYPTGFLNGKKERLHRLIAKRMFGDLDGRNVDHINNNPLDNRRSNLRLASQKENMWNRRPSKTYAGKPAHSKYIGVSRSCGRWSAYIYHEGKTHFLGRYDSEEEAALARDNAARALRKDFAYINLPDEA